MPNYNFLTKFKRANILSIILFFVSIIFIVLKGLNYGIDFKGGTLIELRSTNTEASSIRDVLKNMDLGDVNVKKFGKEGDFLIKVEQKGDNNKLIPEIKKKLSDRFFLISGINLLLSSFSSTFIKKSPSLPNFLTLTSPKSIFWSTSLIKEASVLFDLNSISVPPLKSIP